MELLLWLQSIRTPAMDVFFSAFTHLGDETFAVVVLAAFLWSIDRRFALRLGMVFFMGGMACQVLKLWAMIPRPWVLDPAIVPVPAAVAAATGWSFPSGHTMSAVTLFGCLLLWAKKPWQKFLCAFAALLVAFSRLYLGVHTPLDVGVSLIVGTILTALTWAWARRAESSRTAHIALAATASAVAVALLALAIRRYAQEHDYNLIKGGFAGAGAAAGFLAASMQSGKLHHTEGHLPSQMLRLWAGLAGIALFKEGIPFLLGKNPIATTLAYLLIALWAIWLYPLLISRIKTKKRDQTPWNTNSTSVP